MTLGLGDVAALAGVMTAISSALALVVKYYVKAEIRSAVNGLRLELKQERLDTLEARVK